MSNRPYYVKPEPIVDDLSDADKAEWQRVFSDAKRAIAALPQALKLGGEAKPFDLEYKLDVGIAEPAVIRPAGVGREYARNALGLYTQLQQQEGRGFTMHDLDRVYARAAWSSELRSKVKASDAERKRREVQQVRIDVSMWDD